MSFQNLLADQAMIFSQLYLLRVDYLSLLLWLKLCHRQLANHSQGEAVSTNVVEVSEEDRVPVPAVLEDSQRQLHRSHDPADSLVTASRILTMTSLLKQPFDLKTDII